MEKPDSSPQTITNEGILYVAGLPIGNLEDITERIKKTLKKADGVICEDTRRTQKILNHLQVKKETYSFHKSSSKEKAIKLLEKLKQGQKLVLVTSSGTPSISDPGSFLIEKCHQNNIKTVPLPGPSAPIAALSVAGFNADQFLFLGFIPKKEKEQDNFFAKLKESSVPVCFFESPHRIIPTLETLKERIKNKKIFVGREMTKKFESFYRGNPEKVLKKVKSDPQKGEYTIVVGPKEKELLN